MKQHTIEEIKTPNAKLKARHLIQINRLLNDVYEADDAEWREVKVGCYLLILDMVHVDGKLGSLVEELKAESIYQSARLALRPMLTGRVVTQFDIDAYNLEKSINWAETPYTESMADNCRRQAGGSVSVVRGLVEQERDYEARGYWQS